MFCESDDTTDDVFECAIHEKLTQEETKVINLESADNMRELIARHSSVAI